jgi:hypothetical protein
MLGPGILVRTLSKPAKIGSTREWQYHSRSDRHSKVACWGIVFDLLRECRVVADDARQGQLAFGINHEMSDFKVDRRKNLDLVLCTPRGDAKPSDRRRSLRELASLWQIVLTAEEQRLLDATPDIIEASVGSVRVALEAKAAMTAHSKARPRLYDELNSSHQTIHGNADAAVAVGFVMINLAERFVSPDRNKHLSPGAPAVVSVHKQPKDAVGVIDKVMRIPRRSGGGEAGFDGLAIVVVDCANDGTPVRLVSEPPALPSSDICHYEQMIHRVCQAYTARFARA